jgi:UDP-N-acetylmuramyl pentapeptide synthase
MTFSEMLREYKGRNDVVIIGDMMIIGHAQHSAMVVEEIPPYLADNQVMVSHVSHEKAFGIIEQHLLATGIIEAGQDNTAKVEQVFNQLKNLTAPNEPVDFPKILLELKPPAINPVNEITLRDLRNDTGRIPWNPRKSKKRQ